MKLLGLAPLLAFLLCAGPGARAQDSSTGGVTIISDQGGAQSRAIEPGVKLATPPAAAEENGAAPPEAALPAPRAAAPRPPVKRAELTDARDTPGKIVAGKGKNPDASVAGGGLILDEKGRRLEVIPPGTPAPSQPLMSPDAPLFRPEAKPPAEAPPASGGRSTWAVVLIGLAAAGALAFLGRRKV